MAEEEGENSIQRVGGEKICYQHHQQLTTELNRDTMHAWMWEKRAEKVGQGKGEYLHGNLEQKELQKHHL